MPESSGLLDPYVVGASHTSLGVMPSTGSVRVKPSQWKRARSIVLFIGGLAGVIYTTLVDRTDRPTLLVMFAAMMGLPYFFKNDAKLSSLTDHREAPEVPDPPQAVEP